MYTTTTATTAEETIFEHSNRMLRELRFAGWVRDSDEHGEMTGWGIRFERGPSARVSVPWSEASCPSPIHCALPEDRTPRGLAIWLRGLVAIVDGPGPLGEWMVKLAEECEKLVEPPPASGRHWTDWSEAKRREAIGVMISALPGHGERSATLSDGTGLRWSVGPSPLAPECGGSNP